ncbi:hypothetical protein E3N88_29246 [Mikania micrantha]|uniref:ARID domain-containing protein n=1 Tax=Mikania micrantha TaxID=192012 RepID=A0A5N6MIP9_9ASTR|nr:hypothetical protein E3N88_29246 [Mikania micrantha]
MLVCSETSNSKQAWATVASERQEEEFFNNARIKVCSYSNLRKELPKTRPMEAKEDGDQEQFESEEIGSRKGSHNENEFVVVGTENMGWDDIWYVSKTNVKHLSGIRESFVKFQSCYGIETRTNHPVDLTINGIGEVKIMLNGKDTIISCVSYVPGYERNVLSFEHLLWQGFKVKFLGEKCEIHYMFDHGAETKDIDLNKKQLRLEEELDLPPNLDGYEIEMMHFYLIVKYMGGYEKVTKEERWLDVVDRMGLLVYIVRRVELCYMKYFGILDSYYKTMKDEGVGTSKTIKEGIEAAVTVGQFGSKIKNEEKWVRRSVSAFRSWPYMCGPSYVNDGSKSFSKEITDDEFEDCEKESIGDNETDSRMEADYMDGLQIAGAGPKTAMETSKTAESNLKAAVDVKADRDEDASEDDDLVIILNKDLE